MKASQFGMSPKALPMKDIRSSNKKDGFFVKVANTLEEAVKLMEQGFEYHTEIEGNKLFRKLK